MQKKTKMKYNKIRIKNRTLWRAEFIQLLKKKY